MIKFSTYSTTKKQLIANFAILASYVRTISSARFINILHLKFSYLLSTIFKTPLLRTKAMAISIEPISICNLKCPECPTGLGILKRPKGTISTPQFSELLKHINKEVWHLNLYFQGEPYMHPNFFKLVTLAKKANLVVSTSTNGQYLDTERANKTIASGLDSLIISFDGATQEVYSKYRINGQLNKVIEGTKALVKAKQEQKSNYPILTAQFLVFKYNEHQINDFIKLANDLGIDKIDLKSAQVYDSPNAENRLTTLNKYSRYELDEKESLKIKGSYKNKCWKAWSSSVITWDGNVIPCCFDKDADYNFGNVYQSNLSEINNSKASQQFKKQLLTAQSQIDICQNCPLAKK